MASHSQMITPPLESDYHARKRVCKACDRCRLKKSKCDGLTPCNRCKSDNAICVFGERKRTHDKVYPKGYVEMLEQQQSQLVNGLQELYSLVVAGQTWPGPLLDESTNGRPLTHDILSNLGVLHNDSSNSSEIFEEDLELLQARLERDGVSTSSPKHHSSDSDEETYSNCRLEPPTKRTFQQSTRPSATRQSLSNPSVHSPQAQSGKWQSKFGAASSTSRNNQQSTRPHSIHTYPPFGANQGSIDPSSINPMAMWLDSPLSYDETLDFGSLGDVPSLADARFGTKTQTIAPSMMNANHSTSNFITNWTEDEFTKFMNSSTRT